jgi:TP901 family phage tail tape measure protein
MPEAVDTLLTVLKLVGESTYRAGMMGVRTATHEVQKATQGAAGAEGLLTAAQGLLARSTLAVSAGLSQEGLAARALATQETSAALATQGIVGAEGEAALSSKALARSQLAAAASAGTLAASEGTAAEAAEAAAAAEAGASAAAGGMSAAAAAAAVALGILKAVLVAVGIAAAAAAALGFMALRAALNAAVGEFKKVNGVGGELEATLKDVELQSGATAQQMAEIKAATLSPDLANIGIAATQAAIGYRRLASEGFSVAEMQRMMLPITQATIVLGTDQNETTLLMLTLMRQFNLTAKDMTYIADNLVGALNNTALQGDQVVGVMRSMGLAASMLGWTLSETLAVANPLVGTFGNAEMAGVYFRQMMMQLLDPTDKMAAAFKQAGLDVFDFGKHSKSAAEFIEWLRSGTWTASLIAQAFGVRAAAAAQVMLRQTGPAIKANTAEINLHGVAAKNAAEKANTFSGAMKALAATFANLRARLFEFTKGLSTEWVMAAGLVLESINAYLDHLQKLREHTQQTTTDGKERILGYARAIIDFGARAAIAVIGFSQHLAGAAVVLLDFVKALVHFKSGLDALRAAWLSFRLRRDPMNIALRLEYMELRQEMERTAGAMDTLSAAQEKLKGYADTGVIAATAKVLGLRATLLAGLEEAYEKRVHPKPGEVEPPGGAPQRPAEEADEKRRASAMRQYLEQIDKYLEKLDDAEAQQKANIHLQWDQVDAAYATVLAAQAEAQYAQLKLQWAKEALRVAKETAALPVPEGQEPEDPAKYEKAVVQAQIAATEAETARRKAWQDYYKQAGDERHKAEADEDRMLKKADAVDRAVQRVIGGQLASEVQDALKRLAEGRARAAKTVEELGKPVIPAARGVRYTKVGEEPARPAGTGHEAAALQTPTLPPPPPPEQYEKLMAYRTGLAQAAALEVSQEQELVRLGSIRLAQAAEMQQYAARQSIVQPIAYPAFAPPQWEPPRILNAALGKDRIMLEVVHHGQGVTEEDKNQVLGIVFDAVQNAARKGAWR